MGHYSHRTGFEFERQMLDALVKALAEAFGSEAQCLMLHTSYMGRSLMA